MAMKIDDMECTACGECVTVCPSGAIEESGGAYRILADECTQCDGVSDTPQCSDTCMMDCIAAA